jgi:hypothetical protein
LESVDIGDGNAGSSDRHTTYDISVVDGIGSTDDDHRPVADENVQRDTEDDDNSHDIILDVAGNTSHQSSQFSGKGDLLGDDDHLLLLLFTWMWSLLHRKILQIQLQQSSHLLFVLRKRKRDGNRCLNRAYGLEWMDGLLPFEFKKGIFTILLCIISLLITIILHM